MAKADPKSVPRKRRPYLATSVITNPRILKAANTYLRKSAVNAVEDI
jgi:hypothetical protein